MANRPIRCGVAGAGVFGGYHAAKLARTEHAALVGIYDADAGRAAARAEEHGVAAHSALQPLLDGIDALVVATPATTHEGIAKAAIDQGIHVLVEKPVAMTLEGADAMIAEAKRRGLVLQVGHQEVYVADALGLLDIEGVRHVRSRRMNKPSGRAMDVSVVFDLMIHDLDLLARLSGSDAAHVTWCKAVSETGGPADYVAVDLRVGAMTASLAASRIEHGSTRDLALVTPDGQITLDFLSREVVNETPRPLGAAMDAATPALSDPLGFGTASFINAIRHGEEPRVSGEDGRAALSLALTVEEAVKEAL